MTIKTGDLVVVVRPSPCCGNVSAVGKVFAVHKVSMATSICQYCQQESTSASARLDEDTNRAVILSRLKKIDPPSDGDSLPTKKDIEVTA